MSSSARVSENRFRYMTSHLPAMASPNVTLSERVHALHLFGGHATWQQEDARARAQIAEDDACAVCAMTKRASAVLTGALGELVDRRFEELRALKEIGALERPEDMSCVEVQAIFRSFTRVLDGFSEFCYKVTIL